VSYEFLFDSEALAAACHLDLMEISDKVLISYKIPHLHPGWHDRNNECWVKLW